MRFQSMGLPLLGLGLIGASLTPLGFAQQMERDHLLDSVEVNVIGRKYQNLSQERRLTQLEQQLNTNPPPKASYQYRVNQVLKAQEVKVSEAHRKEAIGAYNRGIDHSNQGNTEAAVQDYQQALSLDPYLIPAYNNLANLQEKQRQFDAAMETYGKALALSPQEPLLHFNLAVIQEKQGKIFEAYDHYRQYVKLSSNPDPQIVELIKNFDGRRIAGKKDLEYSTLTTQESRGERLIWQDWQMPVPVFIAAMDTQQGVFIPEVYRNFDTWTQAAGGRLRFQEVGSPEKARIVIQLQPGPLMDANSSIGHASFNMQILNQEDPMNKLTVNIVVNTGEPGTDITIENRREQVRKLVLHELGHAIGIWGHSKDPGDIMYTHPIVSELSSRDVNTVRKMYGVR